MRVFFATDLHGSDVCWRKFLNAGTFHHADVLVMGRDLTRRAIVPIVAAGSDWTVPSRNGRTPCRARTSCGRWSNGSPTAARGSRHGAPTHRHDGC